MTSETTVREAEIPQAREPQAGPAPAEAPGKTSDAAPAQAARGRRPALRGRRDWQPPELTKPRSFWWVGAVAAVGGAAAACVFTAQSRDQATPHRAAAAGAALAVVVALALLAHVILMWYQGRVIPAGTAGPSSGQPGRPTLAFRRRGLKAAVIGQDGRASTSKSQVVLWTAAVVWGLVDLLLLARAFGGQGLFAGAVTNWRPEYLILLGLPVAAAATAKAVVTSANSGRGPLDPAAANDTSDLVRVYRRDLLRHGVRGFLTGIAELMTGDDNAVAWADLQYVVFTLITLSYFVIQLLGQPGSGLPPVPAALLTLMGVSASGYTANKIVNTKGTAP